MSPDYFSATAIHFNFTPDGASKKQYSAVHTKRQSKPKADNEHLSYDEIIKNSINYAEKKSDETVAGKITKTLPSLFNTIVPILLGATQKGPLSSKIKTGMTAALIFTGADILFKKYDKTIKNIEQTSSKFKEKRREHPVISCLADLAIKGALLTGSLIGITKSSQYLQKKFQPTASKISKSLMATSKKIDKSLLGQKSATISDSWSAFKNNHPAVNNFTKKHNNIAPLVIALGWLGFSDMIINKNIRNKNKFASQKAKELLDLNS